MSSLKADNLSVILHLYSTKGGFAMLRIAICDDMPDFSEQVKQYILRWDNRPDDLVADVFTDADALIAAHSHNPYDIILLDVVMPLLGGIEAASEIRQLDKTVKIVFLTSSPEFAVDSYRVKASNYLLKPVDRKMLYQCLTELAEDILQNTKKLLVRSRHAVHQIEQNKIEYIESSNKDVLLVLTDGRTIVTPEPLYALENRLLLSDGFIKCSRSYIVNIHQIDTYSPKEIRMRSGCRIPISRSCQKEFEFAYFSVLFGKAGEL